MKKTKNILSIIMLLISLSTFSQAIVYKPISVFFGGDNPFGYQQILASANAQNDFQEEGQDPFQQTSDLENFTNSLNRQLLNSLSQDLFQEQFGE